MDKSTSEDVLCPEYPQSSSGSGQILSGQVVSSKVMEEALHLNLKLTPFVSFPGDGSIFKAFVHGKVICTKVLSKILPAVTFKGGECAKEGNEEVVVQNDTLLSFSVIAREMISLRGDAGLDINTDCTVDEKSVKPGQHGGDSHDCNTSIHSTLKDNRDGVGEINSDNEFDRDTLTDDCDTKNDTVKDTEQPCAVPARHKCRVCGKAFENKSMLMKHQFTHDNRKYACSFGCREFTTKQHLVTHMKIHTLTRDHVCKVCSKAFCDASSLEAHQYVHSDDKPFKCTHCDKAYTMHRSLKKHVSREHAQFQSKHQLTHKKYKYACSFGCRAFTTKQQLATHMKIHTRTSTRDHVCNICSKAFFDASSLDTHKYIHSAEKAFKCMHCDEAYTMLNSLQSHVVKHHSKFSSNTHQNMRTQTGTSTIDEICMKSEKSVDHDIPTGSEKRNNLDDVEEINKSEESENSHENIKDIHSSTEDCISTVETKSQTFTKPVSIDLLTPKREEVQCPAILSILQHGDCERNDQDKSDHDTRIDNDDSKKDNTTKDTQQCCPVIARYECWECGQEFEETSMLMKHQLTHEKYKYACSFGCRAFTTKQHLVTHMKIHMRTRDHVCKICSKAFFNANSLETHQYVHSNDKPFKCTHCDRAYTMHHTLKKHISKDHAKFRPNTQQHRKHKLNPLKYACSLGCRAFATRQKLAIHMTIHTQRTRDHVCKICSKAFFNASSLETHQFVHSTEKPFKCTHCDKAYTMRNSLKTHALIHQAEHQPYKCEICGKLSTLKHLHESHLLIHSNVKAFQCEVCGKQFRSKNNLAWHDLVHKGYKKFQCDQCDKSYRRRQYLEVHKKTHTGENLLQCELCGDWLSDPSYFKRHQREYCKGKLNLQCEICGQNFPDNRHLVSHMGLHSGERPFGCDVCGKAFAKPEGLADHMKRHNSETDFRCRFCGKFWINKSELRKHEVHHKRQKLHVRLPEEMKPGRYRPELIVGHRETSGAELGTPGIEESAYTVTDTSGGSGQGHQQTVSVGDGGDCDQRPQPIVTHDENVTDHPMVIYVGNGVGAEQIPQSMAIYIDHAV